MIETLNRFNDNNSDAAKIDPVPVWDDDESFEGWSKEVKTWFKSKGKGVRKIQLLIEYLKRDTKRGLRDIVITEFVENKDFEFDDANGLNKILKAVKEHFQESAWKKTLVLVKEMHDLKQKESESNKDYLIRFSKVEVKMRNFDVLLPRNWLAA